MTTAKIKSVSKKEKPAFSYENFTGSIEGFQGKYSEDITKKEYFGAPLAPLLKSEERLLSTTEKSIAYFSMEYGIAPSIYNSFHSSRPISESNKFSKHEVFSNWWLADYMFKVEIDATLDIPIYGGGLGVLAGDSVKSAADLGVPLVAIGVLWNKGYFKQRFWYKQGQIPQELAWDPTTYPGLIPLKSIVTIATKEGPLNLRLWKYYIYSYDKKHVCPVILLDSNLESNSEHFRKLTDQLYRSDHAWWKFFQRAILGIGGMKALEILGYSIDRYHLNEGHAAFALLEKYVTLEDKNEMGECRKKFAYTCHTPVAAGHDRFKINDIANILGGEYIEAAQMFGKENSESDEINLTFMALNNCPKVNAVAAKHGEVMRLQFPGFAKKIQSITNGVHTHTWVSESFKNLFNKYEEIFGDWQKDPSRLARVSLLVKNQKFRQEMFEAHQANKRHLIDIIKHWDLKENVFTVCWARRIANYKRPALILQHVERLIKIAKDIGPLQIILAGKAHPNDNYGADNINKMLNHIDELNGQKDLVKVLMLENYDTFFGKLLTNSVDVWLNNPLPPFEASGTSGMKAILNGVLQLTTVDGWVVEAEHDDMGWFFGYRHQGPDIGRESDLRLEEDSKELYDTLEKVVSLYYETYRDGNINTYSIWMDKMMKCVERSAFFNTQRMVKEYEEKMWA